MKIITLLFLFYFLFSKLVFSDEIFGLPVITDGDTIKILNNKIRLHGIDAPEKKQKCIKNAKEYNCGVVATEALTKKISKNSVFVLQPSVRPFRGIVHGVEPGSDDGGRGADMPQRGSDAADALERAEQASHDERAAINICCSRSTSFF